MMFMQGWILEAIGLLVHCAQERFVARMHCSHSVSVLHGHQGV